MLHDLFTIKINVKMSGGLYTSASNCKSPIQNAGMLVTHLEIHVLLKTHLLTELQAFSHKRAL